VFVWRIALSLSEFQFLKAVGTGGIIESHSVAGRIVTYVVAFIAHNL
jgi:hypothetical protein